MKKYHTIKKLIIDIWNSKKHIDYNSVTSEIKKHFPHSRWNKHHYNWYRSQIKRGKILGVTNKHNTMPKKLDPMVKRIGDEIIKHVNFVIDLAARKKPDLQFKINRWVYARLMQTEIKIKRPIKKKLWESGVRACQAPKCKVKFDSLKNVEIHRKNNKRYTLANCILVCRKCHERMPFDSHECNH